MMMHSALSWPAQHEIPEATQDYNHAAYVTLLTFSTLIMLCAEVLSQQLKMCYAAQCFTGGGGVRHQQPQAQ